MEAWWALLLFMAVTGALMVGFPVAFTLGGVSLWFAFIGFITGWFDADFLAALPNRLNGILNNATLMAVPVFVFMGVVLEKAKLAESLLQNMAALLGGKKGGLGFALLIVGMLLAASTGIVGATVVTLGLLAMPVMQKHGYDPAVSAGTICASGTLGQIIPPSIVLVLLGDVLSNAYQQAQLDLNIFNPKTVSVQDLFMGALIPGFLLVLLYAMYLFWVRLRRPDAMPAVVVEKQPKLSDILRSLLPPLILILAVLGSIIGGIATPTEAASVGSVGALALAAINRQLTVAMLRDALKETVKVTAMVFMILIGAALFSLVFKGFGGDEAVQHFLTNLPGGAGMALLLVMLLLFLLGFILDFIEITFVVIPIVGPILLMMGYDPVWLGIMIAINLQTSFLTPPFGFALFYLRGVSDVKSRDLYRGVMPFILLQLLMLMVLFFFPELVSLI
ncbi:TRAP transporter large permease subunit [Marinicella sp. S1101]|uniref:TRAP transporter large permease n=1 Tax=Marinicella marina TaxID=2996016 RepID=UPI002260CE1A|nr:TRAP transporter large permease subunit [Marinicella marina]MCX7554289.1 TRAP transporter large permease subunit [Marinicella marina]MDJ1138720.1 TRAP transporter large permease subunit [Marinicella marina]